jgi:CRISPR-associated endonuclease Csn1
MAFYSDSEGNFQPHVCTLWHAVERKKYGFPAVVENPTGMWETILHSGLQYPDAFLEKLPSDGWEFRFSMQQNEMFILGLPEEERKVLLDHLDYASLSPYLYRVQKFTLFDIYFRHHLETEIDDSENSKMAKNYLRINSLSSLLQKEPFKVKLTYLGKIELP